MIGKKGNDAFGRHGYEVLEKYITFGGRITYDEAGEIGEKLVEYFMNEEVDEIYTIHNEFKSTSIQVGKVTKVLPLAFEASEDHLLMTAWITSTSLKRMHCLKR